MKYRFRAIYQDGTSLQEEPQKTNYHDIDRSKLVAFELFDIDTGNTALKIGIDKGQKLIWRRRKEIKNGQPEKTVHLVGKWQKIGNRKYQGLALLFDDGRVEFFNKFDESHPFLREVELLEEEN